MSYSPASRQVETLQLALVQYAHAGNLGMIELYNQVWDESADRSFLPPSTQYRIGLLARILESAAQIGLGLPDAETDRVYYAVLVRQCTQLLGESNKLQDPVMDVAPAQLRDLHFELMQYFSGNEVSQSTSGLKPKRRVQCDPPERIISSTSS